MTEETIFSQAILIADTAERQAFLNRACSGNDDLRRELEQLLEAHFAKSPLDLTSSSETRAFAEPIETIERTSVSDSITGTVIAGKYKLLERIGEGGMGDVWLARQTEPVKRQVAVKLIKAGMDSKQVLARFEAERQALAMMDHPNIAKVLDGGVWSPSPSAGEGFGVRGLPYFVMELVKGVPITEYCDHHKLTPKQRLELFVPVCQAIQHAHQKGVIHRDIKPSNVIIAMYDDRPVPKVIDFGVAKATGPTLTEHTLNTGFGGIVGTPQYMSPEQATFNNLDIDTRSDVYSLGVLLYELLTGSTPFARKELEKKGLLEILRVVREEEPPKPSTKLSTADALPTLSANHGTEPKRLTGILRNELDWIVMKSLEKDRMRRYETANGFAADVNRYLSGEPVLAHPPNAGYRLKKFVRRNRGQVIAASLVVLALLAGFVAMSYGLHRAEHERGFAIVAGNQAYENYLKAEAATNAEREVRKKEAEQRVKAEEAQRRAQMEYEAAKAAGEEVRRNLYFAAMNLIPGVSKAEQYGRVMELLDQQRPKPGESDLRGFEWHYWNRLYQGDRRAIKLNRYRLPFGLSGDGRFGAFIRETEPKIPVADDTLEVMELATGAVIKTWPVPNHQSGQILMSADGRRVALICTTLGAPRGRLQVWNSHDGAVLLNHDGDFVPLTGRRMAFSPNGNRIAAVVRDPGFLSSPVVKVWDLEVTGRDTFAIPAQLGFDHMTFSPDGTRIALGFVSNLTYDFYKPESPPTYKGGGSPW